MTAVTVHAGLRYDLQKFAKPSVQNPDAQLLAAGIDTSRLSTDTNNLGPRIGVAWSPGNKKYVVRAGYGIFYGRTPSIMVGTAHSNNGINVQTITFTGAQVPTYPNTFPTIPTGVALPKPTIFNFDQDYQNPRVQQASAGVEYALNSSTSVSVNYLFVHGDQLSRSTDINIGPSTPVTFTVAETGQALPHYRFAAGPFTNFARIISFQSSAVSTYNGFTRGGAPAVHRRVPGARRLHARQGDRHRPRRHRRRPRHRRRQVRVEPGGLRRRSRAGQQRPAAAARAERRPHDRRRDARQAGGRMDVRG